MDVDLDELSNTGKPLSFAFLYFSGVITPPYSPPSPPEMNPVVSKYFLFVNYFGHFHLRHIRCNYVYFGGISLMGTLCDAFLTKMNTSFCLVLIISYNPCAIFVNL